MFEYVILGVVCFAVGLGTGVWIIMTLLIKGIQGVKKVFRPPKIGGG